jgi:hypothetical protein
MTSENLDDGIATGRNPPRTPTSSVPTTPSWAAEYPKKTKRPVEQLNALDMPNAKHKSAQPKKRAERKMTSVANAAAGRRKPKKRVDRKSAMHDAKRDANREPRRRGMPNALNGTVHAGQSGRQLRNTLMLSHRAWSALIGGNQRWTLPLKMMRSVAVVMRSDALRGKAGHRGWVAGRRSL